MTEQEKIDAIKATGFPALFHERRKNSGTGTVRSVAVMFSNGDEIASKIGLPLTEQHIKDIESGKTVPDYKLARTMHERLSIAKPRGALRKEIVTAENAYFEKAHRALKIAEEMGIPILTKEKIRAERTCREETLATQTAARREEARRLADERRQDIGRERATAQHRYKYAKETIEKLKKRGIRVPSMTKGALRDF